MNGVHSKDPENIFHDQELRIALVMNGGVSLAVWIGGHGPWLGLWGLGL